MCCKLLATLHVAIDNWMIKVNLSCINSMLFEHTLAVRVSMLVQYAKYLHTIPNQQWFSIDRADDHIDARHCHNEAVISVQFSFNHWMWRIDAHGQRLNPREDLLHHGAQIVRILLWHVAQPCIVNLLHPDKLENIACLWDDLMILEQVASICGQPQCAT